MEATKISPDLLQAYQSTSYEVAQPTLSIRVGALHPQLDALLEIHNAIHWAFITAWNPYSQQLSKTENEQRNKALEDLLAPYPYFTGAGVGEDPAWQPEASFLVLNIDTTTAYQLGKQFGQNAIVEASKAARPN